jgi:hypothetical protein
MKNPCLDAALDVLTACGIRNITRSVGSKHLQLRWRIDGHPERMVSLPVTPSDFRSAANTRAQVRHMLREDGVITDPIRTPAPPPPTLTRRVAMLEGLVATLRRELAELKQRL